MSYSVQILDETTAKLVPVPARLLDFDTETVAVRELIRRRVYEECLEHNAAPNNQFRGLVIPEGMERELNNPALKRDRKIDWQKQYAKAQDAFQRNGIIVLVGDKQADNLDETVTLKLGEALEVTFLKLVPLVSG